MRPESEKNVNLFSREFHTWTADRWIRIDRTVLLASMGEGSGRDFEQFLEDVEIRDFNAMFGADAWLECGGSSDESPAEDETAIWLYECGRFGLLVEVSRPVRKWRAEGGSTFCRGRRNTKWIYVDDPADLCAAVEQWDAAMAAGERKADGLLPA